MPFLGKCERIIRIIAFHEVPQSFIIRHAPPQFKFSGIAPLLASAFVINPTHPNIHPSRSAKASLCGFLYPAA